MSKVSRATVSGVAKSTTLCFQVEGTFNRDMFLMHFCTMMSPVIPVNSLMVVKGKALAEEE